MSEDPKEELDARALRRLGEAFDMQLKRETETFEKALVAHEHCSERERKLLGDLSGKLERLAEKLDKVGLASERLEAAASASFSSSEQREMRILLDALRGEVTAVLGAQSMMMQSVRNEVTTTIASQGSVLDATRRELVATISSQGSVLEAVRREVANVTDAHGAMMRTLGDEMTAVAVARETMTKSVVSDIAAHLASFNSTLRREIAAAGSPFEASIGSFRDDIATVATSQNLLHEEISAIVAASQRLADEARERELALHDALAKERLRATVTTLREVVRSDYYADRAEWLGHAIQAEPWVTSVSRQAAQVPSFVSGPTSMPAHDEESCISAAVEWLAKRGEAAITGDALLEFEVTAALNWSGEVFVAAAFRWLLSRDIDETGFAHYRHQLRCGMSRQRLLWDIARSQEASRRLHGEGSLETLGDRDFIVAAYEELLGRYPDNDGFDHYLQRLQTRSGREGLLLDVACSREARTNGTTTASAIRVIGYTKGISARIKHRLRGLLGAERQRWEAGRFAEFEGSARQSHRVAQARISAIEDEIVGMAAIVPPLSAYSGRADVPPEAARSLASVGRASADAIHADLLRDTSHSREVAQIVRAIRAEIDQLGLH